MTNERFMKHLTMMFVASDYNSEYKANHVYTDDEMQAYYDEHKQDIDLASYEVLTVNADYTGIEARPTVPPTKSRIYRSPGQAGHGSRNEHCQRLPGSY